MNRVWKAWPWLSAAALCLAWAGVDALGNGGEGVARLKGTVARMTSGEVSTLHAALFFVTVWIVSSLRIHRLKALWRVGFGLKAMRGISGRLLSGEPKARAAMGGSVGGAGTSGFSPSAPKRTGRRSVSTGQQPVGGRPVLDNFRG
jgi:hypothetical protein